MTVTIPVHQCTKSDYDQIIKHITEFWGHDRTLHLHHPMYLYEFGETAFVVRHKAQVAAYLFGFISQTGPIGYVHLVAVRRQYRRHGLAGVLYGHFSDVARAKGCLALKAITTPSNDVSIAFHKRMGMVIIGTTMREGVNVIKDYAGPGNDRVVFHKSLQDFE